MSDRVSGSALARRGLALFRAGRDAAAIPALGQAIALEPTDGEARRALAAALWRSGRRDDALAALRDAVLVTPTDPLTWHHLGSALLALDCPAQAAWALTEAHTLAPDLPGLARLLEQLPAALLGAPGELAQQLDLASDPAPLAAELRRLGVLAAGVLQRAVPRAETALVVIGGLGQMSPELGREALSRWLADGDTAVRAALARVAITLSASVRKSHDELLAQTLADPAPVVAEAVAETLAEVLPKIAADVALGLARTVWGAAPEHPARAALTDWLREAEWATRSNAEAVLLWLFESAPGELLTAVAGALLEAGQEDLLLKLYSRGEVGPRRQAVELFSDLGTDDLLAVALWDDEGDLRSAAALALARLGQGAGPLRERLEAEPDGAVKHVMQAALRRLEPDSTAEESS